MAQEPENQKNAGLEELEELTQQDRISQIQFNEPELHSFNASSRTGFPRYNSMNRSFTPSMPLTFSS